MDYCPGCGNWFHTRGYLNHLWQTHKPECREILAQSFGNLPDSDSDTDEPHLIPGIGRTGIQSQGGPLGRDTGPLDDGGNAFQSDGEGDGANEGQDKIAEEEDGEGEDLLYDGDEYWEPPVSEQMGMEMDVDEPHADHQEEPELYDTREARWSAEEEFRKTPVVEAFPSAQAGAPIANVLAAPRYKLYQEDLKNSDNPWAPFLSQLDWEVARWAKLRGPSSTAFTEFLKIDGVSANLNESIYGCTLYSARQHRFASALDSHTEAHSS
jgi:hypothetical protein